MKLNKFYYLIFIIILFFINLTSKLNAVENRILIKINQQIITHLDIIEEINYLNLLNPNIKNLDNNKVYELAKNSLIKETIKKIEILKNNEKLFLKEDQLIPFIENISNSLGFKNLDEFEKYILENNYNLNNIKEKLSIEMMWNKMIVQKYINKVKIDNKIIEEQLIKIKNQNELLYLNEILLDIEQNINEKFETIKKSILQNGFENTASIFSKSSTSNIGGKIGWVKKMSLNPTILKELEKIKIGEHTKPIRVQSGFLILKISEKKNDTTSFDIEKERDKLISQKTNEQLNQFSNIFLNKIKKDVLIDEI